MNATRAAQHTEPTYPISAAARTRERAATPITRREVGELKWNVFAELGRP
jgi:hypothetical protein